MATKVIPYILMPASTKFDVKVPWLFSAYNENKFKGWMLQHCSLSGGIVPFPNSKPALYGIINVGFPDIISVVDSALSTAGGTNPVQALVELVAKDLPAAVKACEVNMKTGIGLPDIFGVNELISVEGGLYQGAKFKATLDILDSSKDKKGFYSNFDANIPLPPDFKCTINSNNYLLYSGIDRTIAFTSFKCLYKI